MASQKMRLWFVVLGVAKSRNHAEKVVVIYIDHYLYNSGVRTAAGSSI